MICHVIPSLGELKPSNVSLFATCGHDSVRNWIRDNVDITAAMLPGHGSTQQHNIHITYDAHTPHVAAHAPQHVIYACHIMACHVLS